MLHSAIILLFYDFNKMYLKLIYAYLQNSESVSEILQSHIYINSTISGSNILSSIVIIVRDQVLHPYKTTGKTSFVFFVSDQT